MLSKEALKKEIAGYCTGLGIGDYSGCKEILQLLIEVLNEEVVMARRRGCLDPTGVLSLTAGGLIDVKCNLSALLESCNGD